MGSSKKTLLVNWGALSVVQFANYLLPLVVLPYLLRVIGPEKYGVLAFAQAVVLYFNLIPDLGTNLYAPREIAIVRTDNEKLSRLVSGILALKFWLLLIACLGYWLTVRCVDRFWVEHEVFIFSSAYMLAAAMMPTWFFQGIEKMVNVTLGMLLARVFSLCFIFIIIRQPEDYIYVPLINAGGMLLGALLMLYLMVFREGVSLKVTSLKYKWSIIRDSSALFVSNVAITVYTGINTVILGFLSSDLVVGYYAAAEKLIKAGLGLQGQIASVFYPHISQKLSVSRDEGVRLMRIGFVATMFFAIPATVGVFFYAPLAVDLMFGEEFLRSLLPLKLMAGLFVVIGISNVLGIQILLPLGCRRDVMETTIGAGIVNVVLLFVLVPLYLETGAALAFVGAEVVVTFWMYLKVKRHKLNIVTPRTVAKLFSLFLVLVVTQIIALNILELNWMLSLLILMGADVMLLLALNLLDLRNRSFVI